MAELKVIKEHLTGEASKTALRAVHVNQRLESLARGQKDTQKNQYIQTKTLEDLKLAVVRDIRKKLGAATKEFKKASETGQGPQPARADTYAEIAARQGADPSLTNREIQSYFDMPKRTGTQRPTTAQTDGML